MRTLAIGDIHGCSAALDALLAVVRPEPDDLIITLGDYVDRGPDTRGVLNRLIDLHRDGRLIPLRGNHELMFLTACTDYSMLEMWGRVGGKEALASYGPDATLDDVPAAHWLFLEHDCRDWYETATHIFVHASVEPDRELDAQTSDWLHWQALHAGTRPHQSGKMVVCGHTAQKTGIPLHLGHTVGIDTCAHGGGWLTCLHAETGRVWQANQRGETRSAYLEE